MTNAVNPPKGLGEILEPATPPQFIPAQPELFLPVLDKVVNGIMIAHGQPPLSARKAGDDPFCCRRNSHISTYVENHLAPDRQVGEVAPAPRLDVRISMVRGERESKKDRPLSKLSMLTTESGWPTENGQNPKILAKGGQS